MKLVLGTALMILLAGAPSYARQEPDKDKPKEEPKKQEEPKKGEQPNKGRQDQEKPADRPKQEPDKQPDRAKPAQQDDRAKQNDRGQQNDQNKQPVKQQDDRNRNVQPSKPAQQQDRPQDQQRAQQTQQHNDGGHANQAGGGGRRVPDEQFRASFGSSHHFRVHRSDDRRFNYGGYYFQYSEAWPSDWDYDNDDVYIDYSDGEYYLINPRHPGVRLLVVIAD
jgi:outer membrane biosynthesis protein TonB